MVGPVSLYRHDISDHMCVITAQSFAYTTSRTIWANPAAGFPLQPKKKALRKLDPESSQDDLICAAEEFNQTAAESDRMQAVSLHAPATAKMHNVWTVDRREQALMPLAHPTGGSTGLVGHPKSDQGRSRLGLLALFT